MFSVLAAPDWVTVVPVLRMPGREDVFLMVRQYRHGVELITTEFPAGLVEPGENSLHAALRELEEETGHRAGRMTLLGRVSPNPAFMNNWCSTFLAEDLARVGGLTLDETEELDVLEIPVSTLRESYRHGRACQRPDNGRADVVRARAGGKTDRIERRRSESNRCIKVLQTSPLPLGYGALPNGCPA